MKEISKMKKDVSQDQLKRRCKRRKEVVTDAMKSEELVETEESESL